MNARCYISRILRDKLLAACWLLIAVIIAVRVGITVASMVSKGESFSISRGPVQSLIIYGVLAVLAIFQAGILKIEYHWTHVASNYVASILFLLAAWWFLMGGLVYASIDLSIVMFLVCVASVWHFAKIKLGG